VVDRRGDEVYRHQPEPRRIIAVVPDFDDENIIPVAGHDDLSAGRPGRMEGPPVRARAPGSLRAGSGHRPTIHEMSADQPVEKASTLEDIRAEVLTPDR
jgi:putative ABC transport system permease protein